MPENIKVTVKGLVPSLESVPRKGATSGSWPATLVKWMEMKPSAAAISANLPMRARWWLSADAR